MSNSVDTSNIVFKGIDGKECEEFIAAVEMTAHAEGWAGDDWKKFIFARSRLRDDALRWFAMLDPMRPAEWRSLVRALFTQYPAVGQHRADESVISTPTWSTTTFSGATASLALPLNHPIGEDYRQAEVPISLHRLSAQRAAVYDPSLPGRHIGRLRVVVEGGTPDAQYIAQPCFAAVGGCFCTSGDGMVQALEQAKTQCLWTTLERPEALRVCFIPGSRPHCIGCLNTELGCFNIALGYRARNNYPYHLQATDHLTGLQNQGNGTESMSISEIWNILADGCLEASFYEWKPGNRGCPSIREEFKSTEFRLNTSGQIVFRKPGTPLLQEDPKSNSKPCIYETKARLVFEPL